MSNTARSIYVYGVYLVILGLTLLVIPNVPLPLFGLPTTNEVWIRIVGIVDLTCVPLVVTMFSPYAEGRILHRECRFRKELFELHRDII